LLEEILSLVVWMGASYHVWIVVFFSKDVSFCSLHVFIFHFEVLKQ